MRQHNLRYRCASDFVLPIAIAATLFCIDVSFGQIRMNTSRLLRDVGVVTLDSSGRSQITINPAICRRLGPELCEFYKMHEIGHVKLRHLERGVPARQAEVEADRFAARYASPAAVAAARQHFANGNGGSSMHGSAQQRAQRISQTSINQRTASTSRTRQHQTIYRRSTPSRYRAGAKKVIVRHVYLKSR